MAKRRPTSSRKTGDSSRTRGGYRRHDGFFHRARKEGYVARSAYKLDEIQRRHRLLKPGDRVLDLGCAPGAWLQIAAEVVGERGRVVGVDLTAIELSLPPYVETCQADVFEVDPAELRARAGGSVQAVLSDLAPHTTGVRAVDQARSLSLTERAAELARGALEVGGSFVAKVFDGPDVGALLATLRQEYGKVRTLRPQATRSQSKEIYLIATDFRGARS